MQINKNLINLSFLLSFLFVISCKLLSPDDTTPPEIQLSIAGGITEISREVTLYLAIDDDSKIDYVTVMIDDTIAITVNSNFDTIRFDVTPFADESEHILYVKVADEEGNIGESEKLNVVITEYPGWRIYDLGITERQWAFTADYNGLIWWGNWYSGVTIFNPNDMSISHLTMGNSDLPEDLVDGIVVIDGSRVWISTERYVCEYHHDLQRWLKIINIHEDTPLDENSYIGAICLDKDYNLIIGMVGGDPNYKYIKYNGTDFSYYSWSSVYQPHKMVLHPDGSIFIAGDPGIDVFKNGAVNSFNDFPYSSGWDIRNLVIDSFGNVWTSGNYNEAFLMYNGTYWESIAIEDNDLLKEDYDRGFPKFVDKNGILYAEVYDYTGTNLGTREYSWIGLATYDGTEWVNWIDFDTPFYAQKIDHFSYEGNWDNSYTMAPNGDIWMIVNGKLMRYRPSLGGYP